MSAGVAGTRKVTVPSFSFHHWLSVVILIVLTPSGLVSILDICFVPLSVIYLYYLAKFVFPPAPQPYDASIFTNSKIFVTYFLASFIIGIFLPLGYILYGVFSGDKIGVSAAAPHLFLLAGQGFMEAFAFCSGFSKPVNVVVPILYNARRIFSLGDWLKAEMLRTDGSARVMMGRAFAALNMGFWLYNLFGFLIPLYLPRAFKKYYSVVQAKP